jgi:hypothetical protein
MVQVGLLLSDLPDADATTVPAMSADETIAAIRRLGRDVVPAIKSISPPVPAVM